MATETITSVTVVGQYGCLAFHGPGRERVLIPEPPIIRKVNGENLPKPSEEAERAYQILYLNKLPPLPLKSTPTFIINQGNRNDRFQYTVNGGERNIAGTGLPQQPVENPPPAAYREQPSTSRQQQQHHSLHVTGNDNIANNDGRSGSGLDHCKDLKARSQEIDEQIIAQAQSFANADLRDLETISILQQQIKDLIKIREGLNLSSSSKTPEGVSNLLDHNVGAAHGCFNGNVLDKRDKDTIGRSNSEESIPKEIPQGGQVFNGEQLGAPMGGFEREFPQFEGRERMEKPNWHANRAAMAANNLECVDASNDLEWQRQDFPWSEEANKVNREVFGNTAFRYHQLSIINATMKGHDVFVLMPTGGGKSLCYQLPSVLPHGHNKLKKLTVVISPLISLIQDQVFHLEQLGLHAISLGAGGSDLYRIRETVEAGDLQVVFLTPEKLMQSNYVQSTIRKLAEQDLLARIVIDEAHCVSQWGHGESCNLFLNSYFL